MATVLRVEFADGRGPYVDSCAKYPVPHSTGGRRPSPHDEFRTHRHLWCWTGGRVKFGFLTLDQVLAWFDPEKDAEEVEALASYDLGLAEYEAEVLLEGRTQCLFTPVKRICWIPLKELLS